MIRKLSAVRATLGRRRVLMVSAAMLAVMAFSAAPSPAGAQSAPPIRVGGLFSLTGPGGLIGESYVLGAKMAVDEINKAGGIAGRKVELVLGDTQTDPSIAVNEAKRLALQEKVDMVVGPAVSQEALAMLPVLTEAKLFQISTGASLALTPQVGPYHFSLIPSAEGQGIRMIDYAVTVLKSKAPALLGDNGGQSKTGMESIRKRLAELKIEPAGIQEYPFHVDDMTPQLLSLRKKKPDTLVFFTSSPEDLSKLLKTLQDIDWDIKVVGSNSVGNYSPSIGKNLGDDAFANLLGTQYPGLTYCSGDAAGSSEYAQFVKRLNAYDPKMSAKLPPATVSGAYIPLFIMKAAVEATGSTEGPKLAAWLEENSGSVKNMYAKLSASKTSHFLFGPESLGVIEVPNRVREDGLQKRAGC